MKLARAFALALTVGFLLSAIQAPCTAEMQQAEPDTVYVPYYAGSMLIVVYIPVDRPALPFLMELWLRIREHWPENGPVPPGNGAGGYGDQGWDD